MNICIPYFVEINRGNVIYGYVYFSDLVRINWESSVSPLVKTCSSSEHIVFWVEGTVSLWSLQAMDNVSLLDGLREVLNQIKNNHSQVVLSFS